MTTDRELAQALYDAEESGDTDEIIGAENAIIVRLNIPLNETEQGLTQAATDKIDAFLRETLDVPIRGIA